MASQTATDNHLLRAATVKNVVADGNAGLDSTLENDGAKDEDEEDESKPAETPKFKIFISEDLVSGCWYSTLAQFFCEIHA